MSQEKIARFSDEEVSIPKKSLKLDGSKSQFTKPARPNFSQAADRAIDNAEGKRQKALELTKQFWDIVRDKTLPENKGPLKKDLEKEISNKLISYAIEMNGEIEITDNEGNVVGKEPDGIGSVSLIALLLKIVLYQRDINNLLEKKICDLEMLAHGSKHETK